MPSQRTLLVILGIIVLVLIGEGAYYYLHLRSRPEEKPTFCSPLDPIVEQFADAKREVFKDEVVYTFEGKLVGLDLREGFATYQIDLGKGILLGKPQSIKIPVDVLPKRYFEREVSSKEDLRLQEGELNSFSKLILRYEKPCKLIEWEIALLPQPEKRKVEVAKKEEREEVYTGVARKVLDWLDKQRTKKGVYLGGKTYRVSGGGEAFEDNRAGLAAIWGRFKYVQKTGERSELNTINRDLKTYTDPSKVIVIQNNFWNCRMMYEMWQSDLFFGWQKEKIEKICWDSMYQIRELEEMEREIASGEIETPDLKKVIEEKAPPLREVTRLSAFGGKLGEYSSFVSDFVYRYLWKKDKKDLKRALFLFNKSIELYKKGESDAYLSGRWLLGIASLDLYKVTEDPLYLDFATALYEKERIEDFCSGKDTSPSYSNYCRTALFERVTANLFARELFEATGDQRYKILAQKLTQQTVETAFDEKGYEGFFIGDGAFNSYGRGYDIKEVNVFKPIRANGLMVGILSESY